MRWMTACLGLLACWPLQAPDLRDAWGIRKLQEAKAVTIHRWQSHTGNIDEEGSWSSGVKASDWGSSDEAWVDGILSQKSLTSGLDQSSVTIAKFTVTDTFLGGVGGPGNPLQFADITAYEGLHYRGRGKLYYKSNDAAQGVLIDSPNLLDAAELDAATAKGYLRALVVSGATRFTENVTFGTNAILGVIGRDAKVFVAGNPATGKYGPQWVYGGAGHLTMERRNNSANKTMVIISSANVMMKNFAGWDRFVMLGGYCSAAEEVDPMGTGPLFELYAGTFDLRTSQYDWSAYVLGGFVGPEMTIIGGPVITDKAFSANLVDLRHDYP